MSKTLEQTIHDAELPAPPSTGEDFNSYVSRVAHAAAFIGAAWAITNGPQVQAPQPQAEPVPDPTFDNPITVDGVPAEERRDEEQQRLAAEWDAEVAKHHQDGPTETGPDC